VYDYFKGIDIDRHRDLEEVQSVHGVPTFRFFKNSKKCDEFSGANQAKLISLIERYKTEDNPFGGDKGHALGSTSSSTSQLSFSESGPPKSISGMLNQI
jgi:thioredoxin-like negative regulator of GroEL